MNKKFLFAFILSNIYLINRSFEAFENKVVEKILLINYPIHSPKFSNNLKIIIDNNILEIDVILYKIQNNQISSDHSIMPFANIIRNIYSED